MYIGTYTTCHTSCYKLFLGWRLSRRHWTWLCDVLWTVGFWQAWHKQILVNMCKLGLEPIHHVLRKPMPGHRGGCIEENADNPKKSPGWTPSTQAAPTAPYMATWRDHHGWPSLHQASRYSDTRHVDRRPTQWAQQTSITMRNNRSLLFEATKFWDSLLSSNIGRRQQKRKMWRTWINLAHTKCLIKMCRRKKG